MNGFTVGSKPGGYALQLGAGISTTGGFTYADATTYYIGNAVNMNPTTTDGNARIYIPQSGIIRKAIIWVHVITNTYTNEQSSMSLRVNSTDTLISSTVDVSGTTVISKSDLAIPVTGPTDYFQIKWVTPTWATNTGTLRITGSIFVET